jgi:hypothetical protein
VAGVMGGLLDEVEEDPPEINRTLKSKKDMSRPAPMLIAQAGNFETRGVSYDSFGSLGLLPIGIDRLRPDEIVGQRELVRTSRELGAEIAPFHPPPLHVRQVIDDREDRKHSLIGRPAELLLGQPISRCNDLFALPTEKAEQNLTFVRI